MNLPKRTIDRMDGLVKILHIDEITRTTIEICEDFLEEGFDPIEIKYYLHSKIDNVINFQSESSPYKEESQLRVIDGGRK